LISDTRENHFVQMDGKGKEKQCIKPARAIIFCVDLSGFNAFSTGREAVSGELVKPRTQGFKAFFITI